MNPANGDNADGSLVSPRDVVGYLVQNEPLARVAEISGYVDGFASQLKQDSFAMESLNTAIDTGERMATSIDELLKECHVFYSVVKKRMGEAENVIDTRSQDLRRAIAQLHSTPLTVPPVSSLGATTCSIPQMSAKVEEIGATQTEVLNTLEANRDMLAAVLAELSDRESTEPLLSALMSQMHSLSPPPPRPIASRRAGHTIPPSHLWTLRTLQSHDSLWERYHRGLQEFQSGADIIVRNSETIRDLALILEGARGFPPIMPPVDRHPNLAEELLAWQTQNPGTGIVLPPNPHNGALYWRSLAAWLKFRAGCPTKDFFVLVFAHLHLRPPFLLATSLTVLFVLANIMRARYRISNLDRGRSIAQAATSIRELLLGDRANVSDELLHNLVPRGE